MENKIQIDNSNSELINKIFWDKVYRSQYYKFTDVLIENNVKNPVEISEIITSIIENSIKTTVEHFSNIQYLIMEKSNDWGEFDKQLIIISYAYSKLALNPNHHITNEEIEDFHQLIKKQNAEYVDYSLQELKKIIEEITFEVLDKKIKLNKPNKINTILKFCGSNYRISIGKFNKYKNMIFGIGIDKIIDEFNIIVFKKELIRTPISIMPAAASIGENNISIREESCQYILETKWKNVFSDNDYEFVDKFVMESYNIKSLQDLIQKMNFLIDEMIENIMWHEFGHGTMFSQLPKKEFSGICKAFNVLGSNIVNILIEVLADWSISKGTVSGPILHYINIAVKEKNIEKATRLIMMYISDNWFYNDSFNNSFSDQADVTLSLLCPFIHFDNKIIINFNEMNNNFHIINQFLLDEFTQILNIITNKAKNATFIINNEFKYFDFIENHIYSYLKGDLKKVDKESDLYITEFWKGLFVLLKQFSNTTYIDIVETLNDHYTEFSKKIIEIFVAHKDIHLYKNNLHTFVFDKFKSLGNTRIY